jgi:hypothetical protein
MINKLERSVIENRGITMSKYLFSFATILLSLCVTSANAVCLAFDNYCDGLEVSVSNGHITGLWKNTDCAGTDIPIQGNIVGGVAKVACSGNCFSGQRFGWVAETTLDGTMDMYADGGVGTWSLWIDELAYTASLGSCTFSQGNGIADVGVPSASAQ